MTNPPTDSQKSAKKTVDDMILNLRQGKDIHEQFAEAVQDRMMIQGKTMDQWRKHFRIEIPENPDITACKEVDMVLMEKYQEASFLKAMADASHLLQKKGYETQYRQKFEALVSEYKQSGKKLPAKDTLSALAAGKVDDIETGVTYAELAVRFWKEILDNLNYVRKVIENATINNSVEAKATNNHFGA